MTRLAIIFSLLFVTPAWAETVLYCQTELAAGVVKKDGSWQVTNFMLRRHTVKFDEKNMTLSGFEKYPMSCKVPYGFTPDIIYCADNDADFRFHFDKKSLRYSGYLIGPSWIEDGGDTVTMEHGTCQKF